MDAFEGMVCSRFTKDHGTSNYLKFNATIVALNCHIYHQEFRRLVIQAQLTSNVSIFTYINYRTYYLLNYNKLI